MKYVFYLIALLNIVMSCQSVPKEDFSTIEYKSGACFGTCPIYTLILTSDRQATIKAEHFTFSKEHGEIEGKFTSKISEENYQKLIELINKTKPSTWKEKYGNYQITDLPTAYLTLESNSSKWQTQDYGKNGSPELKELWDFIDSLRTKEQWKKIN